MENNVDRRIKVAWVRPEVFAAMFQGGTRYCVEWKDIPEGARLRNVVFDYSRDAFGFYIQHASFQPVPAGHEVPILDGAYCRMAAVPSDYFTPIEHVRAA